jgi:hypothetical protein
VSHEGATREFGFFIEVAGMGFNDTTDRSRWIQIMPKGEYEHPIHGRIVFDDTTLPAYAQSFHQRVRGTDLDVDYDHKALTTKAAGWYKNVAVRDDGLWAQIEWTEPAFEALKAGEFKYFSPEFVEEWKHPKTGQVHKYVLFGGGLTNRPFLKDILPINLNEVAEGGSLMDPKQLRQLLGLAEDATDAEVQQKLADVISASSSSSEGGDTGGEGDPPAPPPSEGEPAEGTPPAPQPEPVTATEPSADLIKLAETNPAIKQLLDKQEADSKRLAELELTNRTSALNLQLNELVEPGDNGAKRVLSPNARKQLSEALVRVPVQLSDSIVDVVRGILKDGVIELGERGSTGGASSSGGAVTATKKFSDLVDKAMKDNENMSYADAVESVGLSDPELYDRYRHETVTLEV